MEVGGTGGGALRGLYEVYEVYDELYDPYDLYSQVWWGELFSTTPTKFSSELYSVTAVTPCTVPTGGTYRPTVPKVPGTIETGCPTVGRSLKLPDGKVPGTPTSPPGLVFPSLHLRTTAGEQSR